MKKLLWIILILALIPAAPVLMQETTIDCSASSIQAQADELVAAYAEARTDDDDSETALAQIAALTTELIALQDACMEADMHDHDHDTITGETTEDTTIDYADIPQTRTEDGAFVLGDPGAPVTIVEFADFACPHCQAYSDTMAQFIEEYVVTGQARFEYRMFLSGADPENGRLTAKLAECAEAQQDGGFWITHDVLFELGKQGRFNETTAATVAERVGLDLDELMACTEDANQMETDVAYGQGLGVQSTPTVLVRVGSGEPQFVNAGGRDWTGGGLPYELLKAIVEQLQ